MHKGPWHSLTEVARWRAAEQGKRRAYGDWHDADVAGWQSYGELDERARAIAAALQERPCAGERALLLYPPGFEYIAAFFGCLYANVIAVPAYPPDPGRLDRTLPRLQAIIADSQAQVVLTTSDLQALLAGGLQHTPALANLRWIATDAAADAAAWRPPATDPETVAFLQYTSGSTGRPKGVVVTHGNLLHNSAAIQRALKPTQETLKVTWAPPYHDMGLICCIIQAMYSGFPLVSISPVAFLLRPFRWLQAVSKTRADVSGVPNFALDLCVRKVTAEQRARLDLSCLKLLYVSAEPVRTDTLERFALTFAETGFERSALYPTYGLAEATLVVAGPRKGSGYSSALPDGEAREVVSVGQNLTPGGEIRIVDLATRGPLGEGAIGEIWVRSGSVARGYWNQSDSDDTFGARLADGDGPWLRTGDLGFVRDGQLYVSGRLKEVIIIRGRKHFPSDVEDTIELTNWRLPHYRAGGTAAFAIERHGEERLCVAVEVERRRGERRASRAPAEERRRSDRRARPFLYKGEAEVAAINFDGVARAVRRAVAAAHGVEPFCVLLLRPGAVPKTSSGKKQRTACAGLFLSGTPHRDVLHVWSAEDVESPSQKVRLV